MRTIYLITALTMAMVSHAQFIIDWEQLPGNIPKYATIPASATMPFMWAEGVTGATDGLYINVDGVWEFAGSNSSESGTSEEIAEQIAENQIYQAHGTLTENTRQWRYELDAGLHVDRDWKPFGAKFGGHWFIPGIEPGDSPGTDGALFIVTPNDDLLSGINWEVLYKTSTVEIIDVSAGEEDHTLPAMRMETLRGL